MSRCILHFGMHKTGSSSIQESLYRGLTDTRFHYVDLGSANASGKIATAFMERPERYHIHRKCGTSRERLSELRQYIRHVLAAELRRADGRTLIVSAEDISFLQESELRDLVRFIGGYVNDIRAVGYVRPPKGFMESAFQQRVKGSLDHFHIPSLYPQYRQSLEALEHVLAGNVEYWCFNTSTFHTGCVVHDFCRRLGIDFDSSKVVRTNEGLSRPAVAMLYAYRKFGPGYGRGRQAVRENRQLVSHLAGLPGPRFRMHSRLVVPVLVRQREDIAWMERRLGDALAEDLAAGDAIGVRNEADLLTFSRESLHWLREQCGISGSVEAKGGAAQVAAWVDELRLCLLEQRRNTQPVRRENVQQVVCLPHDLLRRLRSAHAECLGGLTNTAAEAFIHRVFTVLGEVLETAAEGPVSVAGLGQFRVMAAGDGGGARKVVFQPKPDYPKAGEAWARGRGGSPKETGAARSDNSL